MTAPIVFFDVAGPDLASQREFYGKVFGWESAPTGHVAIPVNGPLMAGKLSLTGLLRTDPADKVLYIGVPDVTAALEQVVEHGGRIEAPRFEVAGVVVLGLFADPAGNRMGLVEMDGDRARIP